MDLREDAGGCVNLPRRVTGYFAPLRERLFRLLLAPASTVLLLLPLLLVLSLLRLCCVHAACT